MSIGAPEIIIIVLVIALLFGATWAFKAKRAAKSSAKAAVSENKKSEGKA